MDYEKKYKELVEAVKMLKEANPSDEGIQNWVKDNVPELAESDDEKIREALLNTVKYYHPNESPYMLGISQEQVIAWLEKQGHVQKPAWSEEDEIALDDALWCCKQAASIAKDENDMGNVWYAECWLKSLKDRVQPKQEWSEEDENHVKSILSTIECCKAQFPNAHAVVEAYNADIEWLNSLRPQNTWRPSDEQMRPLEYAIDYFKKKKNDTTYLESLYQDLLKLREEDVLN